MHAAHLVPLANKLLVKPVQGVDGMLQLPVEVVVLSLNLPKQAVRQRGVSCSMAVNVAHRHTLACELSGKPCLGPRAAQHAGYQHHATLLFAHISSLAEFLKTPLLVRGELALQLGEISLQQYVLGAR